MVAKIFPTVRIDALLLLYQADMSQFGITQSGVKAGELQGNTLVFIEMIVFLGMFGFVGIAEVKKESPSSEGLRI
ncbi:hypothetical protein L4D76_14160 [Photobacterium sagamiensis]|uniref:hypothetical protein n=1 Tax=Photobacterium sagamiensis TaxID=2910241 RepID=UPI003D125F84